MRIAFVFLALYGQVQQLFSTYFYFLHIFNLIILPSTLSSYNIMEETIYKGCCMQTFI